MKPFFTLRSRTCNKRCLPYGREAIGAPAVNIETGDKSNTAGFRSSCSHLKLEPRTELWELLPVSSGLPATGRDWLWAKAQFQVRRRRVFGFEKRYAAAIQARYPLLERLWRFETGEHALRCAPRDWCDQERPGRLRTTSRWCGRRTREQSRVPGPGAPNGGFSPTNRRVDSGTCQRHSRSWRRTFHEFCCTRRPFSTHC